MDKKEAFYDEQPIDRTPYSSCVWMGLLVLVIFATGVVLLWHAAGVVKHRLPKPSLGQTSTDGLNNAASSVRNAADVQAQQLQQSLQDEVQKQKDAAAQAAAQAVKDAAQQELHQQTDQLKQQLTH